MRDFEDGTPPRPGQGAPRLSPDSQRRSLLKVTSIEEESPQARLLDGREYKEPKSVAAQLQDLQATFEQLLNQTASNMRKDMNAREERINRRLETERKEHQTAVFDLRRDLALQQSADLAAHEERLAHRLDDERREQKAALAELRHEVTAQQELRTQLVALRRDVNSSQTLLAKLANDRSVGEAKSVEGSPRIQPLEQATAAAEAAISDMRRELTAQREQLRLQTSSNEGALAGLRKDLVALQSSEVGSLSEQLHRHVSELTRNIQEVSNSVDTMGNCLRSELRREVERLATELELERAQAEQRSGLQEARGSVTGKRLETVESQMEELRRTSRDGAQPAGAALEARVGALEVSCRDLAAAPSPGPAAGTSDNEELSLFRVALDRTQAVADGAQRDVARLAKELSERQSMQQATAAPAGQPLSQDQLRELSAEILKEVSRLDQKLSEELFAHVRSVEGTAQGGLASCRAALEEASRSIGRLTQDLARERSERCAALADLSCRAEDAFAAAERAERRATEEAGTRSTAPSMEVGDSASVLTGTTHKAMITPVLGSAEHVALAACVGELDAELRMEIGERIRKVVGELRGEIAKSVGAVEAEFKRFSAGGPGLTQVRGRLDQLESARLDLRIGALESAWQRAASLVFTGRQAELGELRLPGVGGASDAAGASAESTCDTEAMRQIHKVREMLYQQAQRLSSPEFTDMEAPPPAESPLVGGSPQLALRGEFCGDNTSQFAGSSCGRYEQVGAEAAEAWSEPAEPGLLGQDLQEPDAAQADQDNPLFEPLISDELKERLEVLVKQVKRTLDRSQNPDDLGGGGSVQVSVSDYDHSVDQSQVVPCVSEEGDAMSVLPVQSQVGHVVERRLSRVMVGPPVLRSVSISAPRRAPSPHRSQSPLRHAVSTTTTTRIRSPSPVRRVVAVSPVQPATLAARPEVAGATGSTPRLQMSGSWAGPAMR